MKIGMKNVLCCFLLLVLVSGACFYFPLVIFAAHRCSFFEIESVLSQEPKQANAFGCSFWFFVDVSIRTLHCSFWFSVGTKNQNEQLKRKKIPKST